MSKNPAISLRSRWLAKRLKAARQRAGYTLTEAGDYLQMDQTSLGRFEKGTHRIRRSYVKDLLDFYGVDKKERDFLLQLSTDAWRKDWSDMDAQDLEAEFLDYTWLEATAISIRVFEPLLIHGLLQTPAYARAATKAGLGKAATLEEINKAVEVRKSRQQIFERDQPTRLTVITELGALKRKIGGPATMKEQLTHLLDVSKLNHVEILVLDPEAEWDPGHYGPFVCIEMPDPYPEVGYIENIAGRTFIEDEAKFLKFQRVYDDLRRLTLTPEQSIKLIAATMKELE